MRSGVDSLLMAVRLVGMGFAVSFPMSFHPLPLFEKFAFSQPCGGFLDEGQVERVRRIFPNTVSQELERICLADDEAQSLAAGVTSMPDLSEEQVVQSLLLALEDIESVEFKRKIIFMVQDSQFGEACALLLAMQRATVRAITSITFNPFHVEDGKIKTPRGFSL